MQQNLFDSPTHIVPVIDEKDQIFAEEIKIKFNEEENIQNHCQDEDQLIEEELQLLQKSDLKFYDTIRINMKWYENVITICLILVQY